MPYESEKPQTNLPILEFYQRLAYKYRNWISEVNYKYAPTEDTILIPYSTTIIDDEEVPSPLIKNLPIGGYTNLQMAEYKLNMVNFFIAEALLARQVLETLSHEFEYNFNLFWSVPNVEIIEYPEILHIDILRIERGAWHPKFVGTDQYEKWKEPDYGGGNYWNILSRDFTVSETSDMAEIYERAYPFQVFKYIGIRDVLYVLFETRRYVMTQQQYAEWIEATGIFKAGTEGKDIFWPSGPYTVLSREETTQEGHFWSTANFKNLYAYQINQSINDRRINVLMDIEKTASGE